MAESNTPENISAEIAHLIELNESKATFKEIIEKLEAIRIGCEKGMEHKLSAGESGAYKAILDTLSNYDNDKEVNEKCLKALISLMTKQPDLLDGRGVTVIISHLKKEIDVDLKKLALKWAKECCTMHEMNRQKIVDANILAHLKELLTEDKSDAMKETLAVCRALVLDDDVRVEFGRSHEHAKMIATETLHLLTNLLDRFKPEEQLVSDVMLTLSTLLVRTEFCKKVEEAGGLDVIKDVMISFHSSEKVNRQSFKLLKALAGNDQCKVRIIQKGFAPVITAVLESNKRNAAVATAGLHCVSALSLRSPENSKAFIEAGIPEAIVDIMRMHPNEKTLQKTASWAIRNIVSRNKSENQTFLDLGVEELLHANLRKFKDIEYDIKSALRDLNCKVQLKEEWTGKGGALTTGYNLRHRDD